MTIVLFPNLLAYEDTSREFARHSYLSFVPQEMSLNIDINRILPVKFSDVSPNLYSKLLTSSLSCNVLNPGKIFHSNCIGSPSILSKPPQPREDFNHPNLSSMHRLIGCSLVSYQDTIQNLKRHRPFVR